MNQAAVLVFRGIRERLPAQEPGHQLGPWTSTQMLHWPLESSSKRMVHQELILISATQCLPTAGAWNNLFCFIFKYISMYKYTCMFL